MIWAIAVIGAAILLTLALFIFAVKKKNMDSWLWPYIKQSLFKSKIKANGAQHVIFCFVDHFEPQWLNDDIEVERARVDRWCSDYPKMAVKHSDSHGNHPKHTFFYPEEEYRYEHLAKLSNLCADGYGEIEIHLHHEDDNEENLFNTLSEFAKKLHENHGALAVNPETGQVQYAFIHGDWALDNSLPGQTNCGVDDELRILKESGCYVDMTLPSAPSPAQTSKINSIYYAESKRNCRKSHDTGVDVEVGKSPSGDLMLIQGPLGLNFKWLTKSGMPHIENSDIRASSPPMESRIDLWVNSHIHVKGRPEWTFVKIHTHGAQEKDMETLLGAPRDSMHDYLESKYNDGDKYQLHYVSAREMYNIVKAAEAGKGGNPELYRDFFLPKPDYKRT